MTTTRVAGEAKVRLERRENVRAEVGEKVRLEGRELEALIRQHLPLVGHLVRQTLGRLPAHVSREDLVSAGMAALAGAAKSFDPARGIPFGSFVTPRIRGAILDELRGLDWASRSVRVRGRQVEATQQELTAVLGRTPTSEELAEALGVGVDQLKAIDDDIQRAAILSLQGFAAGTAEDVVPERTPGPEELLLYRERVGYLHNAVEALPERLGKVVTGYFFQERPMTEIAADLGVTESRVSQLRAEALLLLKDGLNAHLDPELLPPNEKPTGCVARRREAYQNKIADAGTLRSRLARTNHQGAPFAGAGRHR